MGYNLKAQQLDSKVHRPYYAGEHVQVTASERCIECGDKGTVLDFDDYDVARRIPCSTCSPRIRSEKFRRARRAAKVRRKAQVQK